MNQLKTAQNNLEDKLTNLKKLNDLNEEILKLTKEIFSKSLNIIDCDSIISTLNDMAIKLNEINHPEIMMSKKQTIDNLSNILNEAQSFIKEIQNKFHLLESIENDLKSNELKLEYAQNLFSNPHFIEVDEIAECFVDIENQLESIREISQKLSLDLVIQNSNLLHSIDQDLSHQAQILNALKIQHRERRKPFDLAPEETFEPTFIKNENRKDFPIFIDNEETENPQSESEASNRSGNEEIIDEDSSILESNENMNHEKELMELSDWIETEMESLNLSIKSITFDNNYDVIKHHIQQLELKKNNLNRLENSLSQSDSKQVFTKELEILKSKLAHYENYLLNTLENTTDLDNYLSNFRKVANSVFEWIKSSKFILTEEIFPTQNMKMFEKLKEDCYEIKITKIQQLEVMTVEIGKFDIVQANTNIKISVDLLFEQIMEQYNDLCTEMTKIYNNSPMNKLVKLIKDSEEFIVTIFPEWYKIQFRNTIVSSKECIIRIAENRIKLTELEETSKKLNSLIDICNLHWPKIYLDSEIKFPTYDVNSTHNSLEIRYTKTAGKLSEIWKSLNKWMIILEDLKVKWQELNANQEQFQSWIIDIQGKQDLNDGRPLQLNDNSLKEKINFLKNLKSEIDKKSLELSKIMLIDDEVTTVTFSPELNSGENLRSTNTLSDKVNIQYKCLANKVNNQIEKWNNIYDKIEMYHKSADDLKEDFTYLKEQIKRLENQCPLAKDKINSLKNIELALQRIMDKFVHYKKTAESIMSYLTEDHQFILSEDIRKWEQNIIELQNSLYPKSSAPVHMSLSYADLSNIIHSTMSIMESVREDFKKYTLLPLNVKAVEEKQLEFQIIADNMDHQQNYIDSLKKSIECCAKDLSTNDISTLKSDFSQILDIFSLLKTDVESIRVHFEQILNLRKDVDHILHCIDKTNKEITNLAKCFEYPMDNPTHLRTKFEMLQSLKNLIEDQQANINKFMNFWHDIIISTINSDRNNLENNIKSINAYNQNIGIRTDKELKSTEKSIKLLDAVAIDLDIVKSFIAEIKNYFEQNLQFDLNSFYFFKKKQNQIDEMFCTLNNVFNILEQKRHLLSRDCCQTINKEANEVKDQLIKVQEKLSNEIEKLKESVLPIDVINWNDNIDLISKELKLLQTPFPSEDNDSRLSDIKKFLNEISTLKNTLNTCDPVNKKSLSIAFDEITSELNTLENNFKELHDIISLKIENQRSYNTMRGEIEGKIAQIENQLNLIEIPGVSLAAKNHRYESSAKSLENLNDDFNKLCIISQTVSETSDVKEKENMTKELHYIRLRINDLTQHITGKSLQTKTAIRERKNLLDLVIRALEKLDHMAHCVSTGEVVGLEIKDVNQRIQYYQLMKTQFNELVEQSSEWVESLNDDYRISEEIMEIDTKEKLELYSEFREIFQEYHPKKIAALYGARDTRIKMNQIKKEITEWIESAANLRNRIEIRSAKQQDSNLSKDFAFIEDLSNLDLGDLNEEINQLQLVFGNEDMFCPCDDALDKYKSLCETLFPYIAEADVTALKTDLETLINSIDELKSFNIKYTEKINILKTNLGIFKSDCDHLDTQMDSIEKTLMNISNGLNAIDNEGHLINQNLTDLNGTANYIKDNLTPRLDRMFISCQRMYTICNPTSLQVIIDDCQHRSIRLKEIESTCCQLSAFINNQIKLKATEDLLNNRVIMELTNAAQSILSNEGVKKATRNTLLNNIENIKSHQRILTDLEETIALNINNIETPQYTKNSSQQLMFEQIEEMKNNLNLCLLKCEDEYDFRNQIEESKNQCVAALSNIEESFTQPMNRDIIMNAANNFGIVSKNILALQNEIKNHYHSNDHKNATVLFDVIKSCYLLKSKFENLMENLNTENFDTDVLLGISNAIKLFDDNDVDPMIFIDIEQSSDISIQSSSFNVDHEAVINEWLESAGKLLKDNNTFEKIDDLVLKIEESNNLLKWDINNNIEQFLEASECFESDVDIIGEYRHKRELVHRYLNELMLKSMQYNECASTAHQCYQWLDANKHISIDNHDILKTLDKCIKEKETIEQQMENLLDGNNFTEKPLMVTNVLSMLNSEIEKLTKNSMSTLSNVFAPHENNFLVSTAKEYPINVSDDSYESYLIRICDNQGDSQLKDFSEIPCKKLKTQESNSVSCDLLITEDPSTKYYTSRKTKIYTSDFESFCIEGDNQNNSQSNKRDELDESKFSSIDSNSNTETESMCIDSNASDNNDDIDYENENMKSIKPTSSSNIKDIYFTPLNINDKEKFDKSHTSSLEDHNANNNALIENIEDKNQKIIKNILILDDEHELESKKIESVVDNYTVEIYGDKIIPIKDKLEIIDKNDKVTQQFELPFEDKKQNIEKQSNQINDYEENKKFETDDLDIFHVHNEPITTRILNLEKFEDIENEKSIFERNAMDLESCEKQFDAEGKCNQEFEISTAEIIENKQNEKNEIHDKNSQNITGDKKKIHDDVTKMENIPVTNENLGAINVQKIDNMNENFKVENRDISDSDYYTANISNKDLLQSCISNTTQLNVDESDTFSEMSESLSKQIDIIPEGKSQNKSKIIDREDKPTPQKTKNVVNNAFEENTECLMNRIEQMNDNPEKETENCLDKQDNKQIIDKQKNENLDVEMESDYSLKKEDDKLLPDVQIPSVDADNDNSLIKLDSHFIHEEPSENSEWNEIEASCISSDIPHYFKDDKISDVLYQKLDETNRLDENSISTFPLNVRNENDENYNKNENLDNDQNKDGIVDFENCDKDLSSTLLEFSSAVNNIEENMMPLCNESENANIFPKDENEENKIQHIFKSENSNSDSIDDKDKIVAIDTSNAKEVIAINLNANISEDNEENSNDCTENVIENEMEIDFSKTVRNDEYFNENDSLIESQESKVVEIDKVNYETISPSNELINITSPLASNDEDSAEVDSDRITFTKIDRKMKDFLIDDANEVQDEHFKELKSNIESKLNDDLMNLNEMNDNNETKSVSDQFYQSLNDEIEPIEKDNTYLDTYKISDNRSITHPTDLRNIDKIKEDMKNILQKISVEEEIPIETNDLNEENILNKNIECENNFVFQKEIDLKQNISESRNLDVEHLDNEFLNKFPICNDFDFKNDFQLPCDDQEFSKTDITEPKIIPASNTIRNKDLPIESERLDLINSFPILNDVSVLCDIKKESLDGNELEEIIYPTVFSRDRAEMFLTEFNEIEVCEPDIIPTLKDVKINKNLDKETKYFDSIKDFPSLSDIFIPMDINEKSNIKNAEQVDSIIVLSKYSEDDTKVLNTESIQNTCDGGNKYDFGNLETQNTVDVYKDHTSNQTKNTENDIEPFQNDNNVKLIDVLDENIGLKDEITNLVMKAEKMIESTIHRKFSNEENIIGDFLENKMFNEEQQKLFEDEGKELYNNQDSNDLKEINVVNLENFPSVNIDKEMAIEGGYFDDELEKGNTMEMTFDGSQGSNNNALSDDSFTLLTTNGDVGDLNKEDPFQNLKECSDGSNESSMILKHAKFQLFELPINIINEVLINDVALGPVKKGQLIEMKPNDNLVIKTQEYLITEKLPAYLLIKPENSDEEFTESLLERRKISLKKPANIQIDGQIVANGKGPELLVTSPGQQLLVNGKLITTSVNQYFIIEIDDPNWELTCIWQDQMKPDVISEGLQPKIIKEPYINDNTIIVPTNLFNYNRYSVLNIQEGSIVTTDSMTTIMKYGSVLLIQDVSSFKINDNDIHNLSEMECVVIICNPSLPSISNETLEVNDLSKLMFKGSDVLISDLLENDDDKPFDLHENVIQKARETVERISNRRKSVETLYEDNEIVKHLNGLEEWINSKNELLNSLSPTVKDDIVNLKTKENQINKIIDEIELKTNDLEFLEVKLEQYSDDLQHYLSDSLRSRYLILRSGVNSTKLLTHDTLAEIQRFIKNKEKETLQNENRFDEDKFNYVRKISVLLPDNNSDDLPDKKQKEIFKTLSNNLITSQNLLEDLKSDAKIIDTQLDLNENSFNNDLQQDRVVWQLLLSRCKTRYQQLKDQSNSRISKRLSPSFFVMHTDKKIDHLARIQEEIEELFSSNQPKSNKDAYQLMKLAESASQFLENQIINNQLSSTDENNQNKESKNHLLNILNELTEKDNQIEKILNSEIYGFYQFILNLLKDRLKLLDQFLFNDANIQTVIEYGNKEEKLEKSIQTYVKEETKRVSLLGNDITKAKKWHCHKTEYCDKLSELLKKSYDLHSNNPSDFDLEKLRAIDSEMHFIGLNLEKVGVEMRQIMESNYQYEQLLNNYNQFLLTANNKLHGEFVTIKNFAVMKIHVIQFRDYFSNFHVYRESLEYLRMKVSEDVANRLNVQHLEVIKRSDVLEEQAHEKFMELLNILYDWSEFERSFTELNSCLETVEKTFSENKRNEIKSQSEEYLSVLDSLNSKLLSNSSKVTYTLNNGRRIIRQIFSAHTKTDIEEFSEKWEDISSQVSLALKDEKYAVELSRDFEKKSEELDMHIDIIYEIILQIEEQIQIEKVVDFQNIVQRQSSVFHLKQRFFSQENLKKSVLRIGDSILKTKRCNLTELNRQLCSLENKWDVICDKIRDLEELSMGPVFASESFVIPKDDIKSLVRSIEISLDKLKSDSSIKHLSDLEVFDEQLKFLNLKLCTIEPLIDLYCQRNPGLQADILNEEMTKKSLEIRSLNDNSKEIIVIMKEIDELSQKVVNWTSSQFNDSENIIKGFNSKMNIKLGITKIKSLKETSNHHNESIKQIRSLIGSFTNLNTIIKLDISYMSDWINSIETVLVTESDKLSQIVSTADVLLQYWKELEKFELTIFEMEIDVDHFIGETKLLVFNSLNCIKFHLKNLENCNERLFGQNGAYVKHEKQIELITNELYKNFKVTMNTISSHSLPSKMKLLSKITPYSNHLSNLLDHWEQFNEYLKQSIAGFEQMEALIIDCFNPLLKNDFNLSQHLYQLENSIKNSQNISNKITGIAEYLIKIVGQNTVTKFRNTLSINNHRLYRIKKYRDSLKNKFHQQENDIHFFDLHCQRMEKINNEVDMSFNLIMPSKLFDSSFDYSINDILKEIIESRRDINEIKSIAHRFIIDNTRKIRYESIFAQRESLINKILQTIQDRDVENCGKMDFMTLCNYCMDLMRFLEPHLQQQNFNHFDEVIEQQLCFEFLHLLIHPKESLFLVLVEKGNLNQKENCGHFQHNLNLLKLQWSNITEQINNSKRYLDKTVVTYLEFLGKIESFRLWCDNLSNRLIDFESDIWSVDEMKHFQLKLSIFTQDRDAHLSVYEACLSTGENVYRTVLDSDTKCRIQEDLQELHEKWGDISDQLTLNSEKLSKRFSDWYSVDESIQNLFAWIKEISIFTTSDIPYYEGLNLNLQKSEKFLLDLKSSQSLRSDLRKMISELVCFLGPDDTTILFNRVYLIDKQCQELAVQIEIRRREIQNRMSVWPQFIDDCRKLTLELVEICKTLDNKEIYQVEEMITKLELEIIPTVNDYKLKYEDLKSRGTGIQKKSGEDRSKDIAYRLQKFEDIWNDTHNLANNKLKELRENYDSIGSFEEKSGNLKKWMLEIKESLNYPIELKEFRMEIPIKLLDACKIQHENIQSHTGDIKSLLLLCNLLMRNNDACPNHNAKEEILNTRKKLKKRWENINEKINSKMEKLNDIISVWKIMEMRLTETDYFINEIDGRLNNLVANIDTNPDKNLDKIQILKSDINDYESEMRCLLESYESMSTKDQLDCRGQIDDQMKKLLKKFENIQEEVSILDAQMKQLATVKVQLQSSIETIKLWIEDVDKEISQLEINQPKNMEIRKVELQEIKLQFHDQLIKLKDIEAEPNSLLNNSNFSEIFAKLKESESVIHNLSVKFRNNIRPSSRKSSQSRAASRNSVQSSASLKSNKSHMPWDSLSINEVLTKANGIVQDLNSMIVGVDQYLAWTNKLLNSVTGDIKSITFEDKNFNSFLDLIVTSRYKMDLIKGFNNELKQIIQTNNLKNIQNYSAEAVEDIQVRWKCTYELCVERDKNDLTKINIETHKEISNPSGRKSNESPSSLKKFDSRKSSVSHRKQSVEQDLSLKESEIKQLVSLENWIKESLSIIGKKSDLTNLSIICKLGLAPIQSELESLRLFLNGYINWNFIYNGVISSPNLSSNRSHALSISWKELKRLAECWIENMQKIICNSTEMLREINRIKDKIQTMKNESRNVNAITDDFIDRFDEIKNCQVYWKTQIEPISIINHHNLTMNRKLAEDINKIMKDLKALDNLVVRISQAIITSDSLNICNDDIKRSSPFPIEDDMETTPPIPTSASFSDDDLANNSSLMVPSISSFEQPYVPVVSGDLISGGSEIRLRVADKLLLQHNSSVDDPIMLNSNIDNQRLAQGDFSYSFMHSEDLISVSATWTKKLCQSLLISIPIILFIVILLFVLFMLQPECENSWKCSSPLSGISVKKHWSKSAAI